MPTLSFEGRVIHADSLDRRELIRIAPSVTVDKLINRVRTAIDNAEIHEIDMADLTDAKASVLLFAVSNGTATIEITDDTDLVNTYVNNKMIIGLDMLIKGVKITGNEAQTVYDLILASTP